jgi:hypothetical protein
MKIVTAVFKEVPLCSQRPKGRALILGAKMFVLNETDQWHMDS